MLLGEVSFMVDCQDDSSEVVCSTSEDRVLEFQIGSVDN